MDKKIFDHNVLEAFDYDNVLFHNRTLNLELLGPIVHIKIDDPIIRECRFLTAYESSTQQTIDLYVYDKCHLLWIDIPVENLNLDIGMHVYTLEFVNTATGDTVFEYFCYTIQSDNPDKPYIYMNRGD